MEQSASLLPNSKCWYIDLKLCFWVNTGFFLWPVSRLVINFPMSSSYGLPKEEAESYVLCDTIGSTGNHQWRPEGFRVVGENERPLLLQSLWKPREGLARRFEIQRKSWVEERTSKDKDTITAGTMSTVETDRPLPNSGRLGIALKCIKKIEIKQSLLNF